MIYSEGSTSSSSSLRQTPNRQLHRSHGSVLRSLPWPGELGRYVPMRLGAVFLFVFTTAVLAAEPEQGANWSLTHGHWGHAPLRGFDIDVQPHKIVIEDCAGTYKKEARFETTRARFADPKDSEPYDAFLFLLIQRTNARCKTDTYGPYLLMEIPRSNICHARVSFYRKLSDLPSEEERHFPTTTIIKGAVSYSAGYGLRSPARSCTP